MNTQSSHDTHLHEAEAVWVCPSVAIEPQFFSSGRLSRDDTSDQGGVDIKAAETTAVNSVIL